MDQTFTFVLLLLSLSGTYGKYVYVPISGTRSEVQMFCQRDFTELAPINNVADINRIEKLGIRPDLDIWIGLERDSMDRDKWFWSGGGEASTFFWADTQPNSLQETYVLMKNNKWHVADGLKRTHYLCYNVIVVREAKTWEEALEHCRLHHRDLASVASETEQLLIQRELQKYDDATQVWTGLRFFPGGWLWVDNQTLEYEAWGQGGRPECPEVKLKCATFRVMEGSDSSTNIVNTLIGVNGGIDGKISVWEAHDCEKRLPFICY